MGDATQFTDDYVFRLWEQSDQESERKLKKILASDIDMRAQAMCEIVRRIKKAPDIDGPLYRWEEAWAYPTYIKGTLTADGGGATGTFRVDSTAKMFGEATSAASILQVMRVGSFCERESDGVKFIVTGVTDVTGGAPWDIVVAAHGNNVLTTDSADISWRILGESWKDMRDVDKARGLDLIFREVGTQIFAEAMEIPETVQNTKYENRFNTFNYHKEMLEDKLTRQLAYAILRGEPKYASGAYVFGNKSAESFMCGISTWPKIVQAQVANANVYVNAAGERLRKATIDTLVRNMMLEEYSNFNSGDWVILTHPLQHEVIHDFMMAFRRLTASDVKAGNLIKTVSTKIGKDFEVVSDQYMRPDTLLVVNLSKQEYGYYAGDTMHRKELATQGRYNRWLMSYQTFGVVSRDPRANIGMIYGLPTE